MCRLRIWYLDSGAKALKVELEKDLTRHFFEINEERKPFYMSRALKSKHITGDLTRFTLDL